MPLRDSLSSDTMRAKYDARIKPTRRPTETEMLALKAGSEQQAAAGWYYDRVRGRGLSHAQAIEVCCWWLQRPEQTPVIPI
jgi:hypothetical protein